MKFPVVVVVAVLAFWAEGAAAQLFSPGPLHRQHTHLEGLGNCLKCHDAGNRLSNTKCIKCHKEIKARQSRRKGYHGNYVKSKPCFECHREHKGKDSNIIVWAPSKSRFPHSVTGFKLEGKHSKAKCTSCHQPRRIKDADVKKLLRRPKKKVTFLGMKTSCKECHFDEHRGQLKTDCKKCHTAESFAPAKKFKHNRDSRFRLRGKHRRVKCKKCHDREKDMETVSGVFPAPVKATFAVYRPVRHNRCTDCHRDPHRGKRGRRCETCHTTKGWDILNEKAMDISFHKTTRFPLEGGHVSVACKTCHGPFKGQKKAVFKDIPFARCDDCHHDAHVGQLDGSTFKRDGVTADPKLPTNKKAPNRPDCRHCHTEASFGPALFEIEDHGNVGFALEGQHRAVDCRGCHINDRKLKGKVSRAVRVFLKKRSRLQRVSTTLLAVEKKREDCVKCHDDTHQGQFDAPQDRKKTCNACHVEDGFLTLSKFDHNRDSSFNLSAKHAEAPCHHCHLAPKTKTEVVLFRGLKNDCASCHVDIHAGQFANAAGIVDCARCHEDKAFKPASLFDHQDPSFTSFALRGNHLEVKCDKCHQTVAPPGAGTASETEPLTWYRGVPNTCVGCHQDEHQGAFDAYVPEAVK